jgi:uncharacterized membrane protein YphA (DoxX/SURF4 family)
MAILDMQQWLNRWNAYWFPKTNALNLSVCRIIVVAAQLFLFFPPFAQQMNFLERGTGFIEPQLLIQLIATITPNGVFFTPSSFILLYWTTVIAGITCLIGLFTRSSAFLFALGNWIFVAHAYSYGEEHHSEAILCMFLMFLAFSPSGGRFSVDAFVRQRRNRLNTTPALEEVETAIWPLKLAQVLLALAYFSTGLAKVLYGGISWMNGYTLQQSILGNAVLVGSSLGIWLAQQHAICILLSIVTIFFELFFFIALIVPWTAPFFVIGGIFFHTGIYLTMGAPFFQHIALYVVFIDFHRILSSPQWTRILARWDLLHLAWPRKRSAVKA